MFENLDALTLARIQFAFTVSFHILFPAFTIGLASWLAVLEWRWLKTGNTIYAEVYRMWVKIFAVTFGMGVVSGVVLSFQFGTNWSVFADKGGNVLGPLLGYEVLTAFFLEASFLGVMLFGWNRVSPKMHFASTVIVAAGTLISAFWILSANSWMQTPQGFRVGEDGLLYPTDWLEVIFNPSFPYRFTHVVTASYLTTAFVVAGIGAFYLWRQRHVAHARVMFGMAMIMAVFVAPMQLVLGDLHGLNTLKHQPAKVSAMEGLWDTQRGAPLLLFGWPDQEKETTKYSLEIPKLVQPDPHPRPGRRGQGAQRVAEGRAPARGLGVLVVSDHGGYWNDDDRNRGDRVDSFFQEAAVRHEMVSILVHGPDPGRVHRRAGRMVRDRNRPPAVYRLRRSQNGRGRLPGPGSFHRHLPDCLRDCLRFRVRGRQLLHPEVDRQGPRQWGAGLRRSWCRQAADRNRVCWRKRWAQHV